MKILACWEKPTIGQILSCTQKQSRTSTCKNRSYLSWNCDNCESIL